MRRSSRNLVVVGCMGVLLIGLWYTPFDPYAQSFFDKRYEGPSLAHFFGVDKLGQDYFSRIWRGAGNSIGLSFLASAFVLVASTLLLVVEEKGGRAMGRMVRGLVAFGIALPGVFMGLLIMTLMERSPGALAFAISLAGIPFAFRQLRVMWQEQVQAGYVEASRAIGGSAWHTFRFSILPNLLPQFVELWKLVFAFAFLELSGLTYLGLTPDPNWAELGTLLKQGQGILLKSPGFVLWPGLLLCGVLASVRLLRIK